MAEFKAVTLVDNNVGVMGGHGEGQFLWGSVTPTAGAKDDIYIPLRILAGMEVVALIFNNEDLDSNGTPTIAVNIGYRPVRSLPVVNATYWASASTLLQAAGTTLVAAAPIKFEYDVDVIMTLTAAAATFAAGRVTCVALGNARGVI